MAMKGIINRGDEVDLRGVDMQPPDGWMCKRRIGHCLRTRWSGSLVR